MLTLKSPCSVSASLKPKLGVYLPHLYGSSWAAVESLLVPALVRGSPSVGCAAKESAASADSTPGRLTSALAAKFPEVTASFGAVSFAAPDCFARNWRRELI